jgi:hypothetical protein
MAIPTGSRTTSSAPSFHRGRAVHWTDVDEDISDGMLHGVPTRPGNGQHRTEW